MRRPGVSVRNSSLSACSAVATEVATSSIARLKASPVGEKPNGDSSTMAPPSSERRMPATSTLRTTPVLLKSTPSMMPSGRAVMKLPEMTRTVEPAIGVLGSPWLKAASISKRSCPAASCAQSSATASVMRWPCEYCGAWPLAASCSLICGRKPCTSTSLTPMLWISARSVAMAASLPAAIASPTSPTTKVLPRCMWM
jgi:hypothetical protein